MASAVSIFSLGSLGTLNALAATITPSTNAAPPQQAQHRHDGPGKGHGLGHGPAGGPMAAPADGPAGGPMAGPMGGPMGFGKNAATILGVTQATLMKDLHGGESLLQIAQSKGMSQQTLVADLEANLKTRLDAAVTKGHMTSAQEQQILANYAAHAATLVTHQGTWHPKPQQPHS